MSQRSVIFARCGVALCLLYTVDGCQQKMADQPSYRPLTESKLFADGRAARPHEAGTVAQGESEVGRLMFTGLVVGARNPSGAVGGQMLGGKSLANYSTQFPVPITLAKLQHGQQRYTIYCAVCHGPTGNGDGIVVQRGYTKPPSYLTDDSRGLQHRGIRMSLRDVPVGYLFEVISKGYGAMADYSAQVPAEDRWDIVAYVRTLQFSQGQRVDELSASQRAEVQRAEEATP